MEGQVEMWSGKSTKSWNTLLTMVRLKEEAIKMMGGSLYNGCSY